jgi:hypothetical protein
MCDQKNNLTLGSESPLGSGAADSLDHARLPTNLVRQGIDSEARHLGKVGYASGFSLQRVMMHGICLLRRPSRAAFFLAGIRRELTLVG